jgi:hypothetical protein
MLPLLRLRTLSSLALLAAGCGSILGLEDTSAAPASDAVEGTDGGSGGASTADGGVVGLPTDAAAGTAGIIPIGGAPEGGLAAGGEAGGGEGGIQGGGAAGAGGDSDQGGTSASAAGGVISTDGGAGASASAGTPSDAGGGGVAPGPGGGETSGAGVVPPLPPPGALARDGLCVAVTAEFDEGLQGFPVRLAACDGSPAQTFRWDSDGRLASGVEDAFLEVNGNISATGAPVSAGAKNEVDLNQRWSFDNVYLLNVSGLCVGAPYNDFSEHIRPQLELCKWDDTQLWSLSTTGAIAHGNSCLDVYSSYNDDGAIVQIYGCNPNSENQHFLMHDSQIEYSRKCVGPFGFEAFRLRSPLELQTCREESAPERTGQRYYVEGPIGLLGNCLDTPSQGEALRLAPCDGSERQRWQWFF